VQIFASLYKEINMKPYILFICFLANVIFVSGQLKPILDKQGNCGYKDAKTGKFIKCEYVVCGEFKGNEALVTKDEKYYVINKEGKQLIKFDHKRMYHSKAGEFTFLDDSLAGTVNSLGVIMSQASFKLLHTSRIVEDLFVLESKSQYGIFSIKKGILLPVEYECEDFMGTFNWDGDLYFDQDKLFCLKRNGKWGITDVYGKTLVSFEYDLLREFEKLVAAKKDGKWGLVDKNKKVILPFEYDMVFGMYKSGPHMPRPEDPYILLKEGKIVFYNSTFNKFVSSVPPGKYDWERPERMNLFYNGKYGVIDYNGTFIIPFEYDDILTVWINDTTKKVTLYEVKKDKQWALFNPAKGVISPFKECEALNALYLGGKLICCVKSNDKIVIHDENLKPLSLEEFSGYDYSEGVLTVFKGEKHGYFSIDGNVRWE